MITNSELDLITREDAEARTPPADPPPPPVTPTRSPQDESAATSSA